jgi:protein CMS1
MADDLEENYVFDNNSNYDEVGEENLSPKSKKVKKSFTTKTEAPSKSNLTSVKKKKKTITEIMKTEKEKFNDPKYIKSEFVRVTKKYANDNLSTIEKIELNLQNTSNDDSEIEKKLNKMLLTSKGSFSLVKKFRLKLNKKLNKLLKKSLKLKQKSKTQKPSPFVIILCSSALRCLKVQRMLSAKNDLIKSKKLIWMQAFAKHKKLKNQIELIKNCKNQPHLIFATPQRLMHLINADCFDLGQLKYVLVDYTYRDCKLKRFFDIPEIKNDFLKLFFEHFLKQSQNKIKFFLP